MKNKLRGSLCLWVAVIIWGASFIAQSVGMDRLGPFTFQTFRCVLAVAFLLPVATLLDQGKCSLKESVAKWKSPQLWKAGLICGFPLFCAASLQQIGLMYTDAGKAGFITAMYIVLVPVFGLFLKRKPAKTVIFSVVLAVIGLYLLSCIGVSSINKGDILLMGCAVGFAVQILCVDHYVVGLDGFRLNCIQAILEGVLSCVLMLTTETVVMSDVFFAWQPIAFAGVLSTGVAFSLQIVGQKDLEPTSASIIMSMESVVAVICGALILKETMTVWEISGCILMFAAVILSQLPDKSK